MMILPIYTALIIEDNVVIGPGQNPTGKLVWVTPKNYSKRVLVFKPTFASEEISYNIVKTQ